MVGGAFDGVVQGMAATVFVVVFGFGHRVVHVNSRNFQLTFFQHFQQTVYTSGGFFRNTVNAVQHLWVFAVYHFGQVATIVQNHIGIPYFATVFFGQNGLLNTPQELFFGFTFPGKHRNAGCSDGCGSMILGGENIAGRPAHFCT